MRDIQADEVYQAAAAFLRRGAVATLEKGFGAMPLSRDRESKGGFSRD